MENLDELLQSYLNNKTNLDELDKTCKAENAKIKELMVQNNQEKYDNGTVTANIVMQHRYDVNEVKLLDTLKRYNITSAIKTVEVVDMDELERYLYNNTATKELADDLAKCKTEKVICTLKVGVSKGK